MERVKSEVTVEIFLPSIADSTSDVTDLNETKKEFSISDPNLHVKHEETSIQSLDLQIESVVPDLKFGIKTCSDDISIKLDPLVSEELHMESEVEENFVDQSSTQVEHFCCDLCNNKFASKRKLQQHLKIHAREKLMKTHTGEKPFQANALDNIINKSISYEDKLIIKNLGAPRPDLMIVKQDKRKGTDFNRKFNKAMYNGAKWLCGCDIRNAFFCFVCIMINSHLSDDVWTKKGITDLKHLGEKIKKHRISARHLHNEIEFAMLGRSNIQTQLDSAYRLSIKQHNENVKKNRYILNKIIDCIKFCGAFELALRGHEETNESTSPGIFNGLINLLSEVDDILKQHLNSSSAFMGLSKTIQNDILDAILHVCRDIIKSEIESTDFLALQADETTDSANTQQMVLIYRYELKGQIYERFWGFFCPENCTAEGFSAVILEQCQIINIHKTPNKLISQSYDSASAMRGITGGVQVKVKNLYKQAHFIHCYAHQLNLIMEKAASQNKKAKIFFANLEGFPKYFSQSAKRTSIFKNFMDKRIPGGSSTRWNFRIRTVSTVYTYKDSLIECFDEIIDNEADNTMQRKMDPLMVKTYVSEFKKNIQNIRDGIDTMCEIVPTSSKRPRQEDGNRMAAKEVCDIVITCTEDRFEFSNHLALSLLLCPDMFRNYRRAFPENTFRIATTVYPFLESNKLKQELIVLYSRGDFSTFTSALSLLQMFGENNLLDGFSETVKLLKIICTVPMTTMESERTFSTLKRIKTFLRSTMSQEQDRLSALAMCSIEKDLIQNTPDFNTRVIEHFSHQNERHAEFIYKRHK